jgi:uncharacterized protein (TIGR03437 family)
VKSSFHARISLLIVSLFLPVLAVAQPVVWTTSSLVRTGPNDAAGAGAAASISAARGEYESFQIAVQAPAGGLTNVNATVSDLSGPGGATIAKSNFSLFREQYVYVSQSSPNWNGSNQPLGAGWYPDALIPFTDPSTGQPLSGAAIQAVPFNLSTATNQPIWVDLFVPRNAAAGQYTGTWTIISDQGSATGTIALTVWDFTLPAQSSLKSAFLFWNDSSLASDEELLRNKISPLHADPSIQSNLMNNFGLSTVGLSYWSGANVGNCSMSAAPSVSDLQATAAQQAPGLTQLIYSADEITNCPSLFPTVKQWANNMHHAGIDNLITMAPNPLLFDDGSGSGRSAVDIWTMLPIGYDQAGSANAQALAKGDSLWSYNALVQDAYSPKWEIDFAPINFRIQPGFISQSLGLTGLLYWKVDGWSSDPWNQVNNTGTYSAGNYPGEGMLVYPGSQIGIDGVAPSMRLKWLRDGIEDYEYVQMLKQAGQAASALQSAASVGASWSTWTKDPNLLLSVRAQLGSELDQLGSGGMLTTSAATANATIASCSPASLSLNFSQPSVWATAQVGKSQTIQIKLTDNCGNAITAANGGTASAAFDNGDTSVNLQDQGSGIWSATWTPANPAAQVTLTATANGANFSASAQIAIPVVTNSGAIVAATVVNAAAGAHATPQVLTPGYISIFGTNLSSQPVSNDLNAPMPTALNGTQVYIGSQPLQLLYVSPGQINALLPSALPSGQTYSLVVADGIAQSAPLSFAVTDAQPALYAVDGSGSGQGVIEIAGTGSLAATALSGSRPARPGEYLTIYCDGLGPVAAANGQALPASGAATPVNTTFTTTASVSVSIGGVTQPVQFSGLAPAMTSVYQVNAQVPNGVAGDAVPVIVTVTDPATGNVLQSNTVTVAVQ